MNAMKLNAICLKLFYSTWFQSVFKIFASRRKWWGEEQGAKGWFCFCIYVPSWFPPENCSLRMGLPLTEARWMFHWKHQTLLPKCTPRDQLRYSALTQPTLRQKEGLEGLCLHKAPVECTSFQNQSPRLGKSSTQLTPDLWCWGKRTLSLSTVAGPTFAEGNPRLIFMAFFCS